MASRDYLLATIKGDAALPAFAELLFLDQIGEMAVAAGNHVTHTLSERAVARGDRLFPFLISNLDLAFDLSAAICQYQCLLKNDASVAEALYGLKRVSLSEIDSVITESVLTNNQRGLSILTTAVMPMIFSRLDRAVEWRMIAYRRSSATTSTSPSTSNPSHVNGPSNNSNDNSNSNNERSDTSSQRNGNVIRNNDGSSNHSDSIRSDINVDSNSNVNIESVNDTQHTTTGHRLSRIQKIRAYFVSKLKEKYLLVLQWLTQFYRKITEAVNFSLLKFCQMYPILKSMYKLSVVSYKCSYMLGLTTYIHPILALLNISLVKNKGNIGDIAKLKTTSPPPPTIPPDSGSIKFQQSSIPSLSPQTQAALLISALISIRIMEHLMRSDRPSTSSRDNTLLNYLMSSRRNNNTNRNDSMTGENSDIDGSNNNHIIPSPTPTPKTGRGCLVPPTNKSCSICRKKQIHPCASTSGFVFCYLCLLNFVRKTPFCPVAGIPCDESEILRLFHDANDGL